eukprot:1855393-Pyramimonas_sp.AAC.1
MRSKISRVSRSPRFCSPCGTLGSGTAWKPWRNADADAVLSGDASQPRASRGARRGAASGRQGPSGRAKLEVAKGLGRSGPLERQCRFST